jgi:hypothetical protein
MDEVTRSKIFVLGVDYEDVLVSSPFLFMLGNVL